MTMHPADYGMASVRPEKRRVRSRSLTAMGRTGLGRVRRCAVILSWLAILVLVSYSTHVPDILALDSYPGVAAVSNGADEVSEVIEPALGRDQRDAPSNRESGSHVVHPTARAATGALGQWMIPAAVGVWGIAFAPQGHAPAPSEPATARPPGPIRQALLQVYRN